MNEHDGLALPEPKVVPELDAAFRPAALANRAFRELVGKTKGAVTVEMALEQADGAVSSYRAEVLPEGHANAAGNFRYVERILKFLLWSCGGWRIHFKGPKAMGEALQRHYAETATGRFDSEIVGRRIYDRPIEVVLTSNIPEERRTATALGRHLEGCRIGFDLGGSDRKVAAVMDGKVVFSEETVWDPVRQADPQYHIDGVMESLKAAAKHLPRVDAIGGSAAGVYVNNRVKVASLFRGVSPEMFERRVEEMFLEIRKAWGDVPFEIVNDGEVTALAGAMALGRSGVLGIAMGTSMAGGYVNREGNITSWLNELVFAPVDYRGDAPVDEWSGDRGCGVQYFSQQAVGRLLAVAGVEMDSEMTLPEKLRRAQELMMKGDERVRRVYETIGTWLGYAIAHYADFYDFGDVLILGRVMTGVGGDVIVNGARVVLEIEFPKLAGRISFHVPDETEKRHGQAIAAASLPELRV